MGKHTDELVALIGASDPFTRPRDEIRQLQVAALNERLEEAAASIPALSHRRDELGAPRLENLTDVVPMLFSFRTYRSYPDNLLAQGRWPMLTRWLSSFSSVPTQATISEAEDVDDWLEQLAAQGHRVQVNPSSDGKCAFLDQTERDFRRISLVPSVRWATGIEPRQDMCAVLLIPRYGHNVYVPAFTLIAEAYGKPGDIHFLSEDPAYVADTIKLGTLSRAMLRGEVDPTELAKVEEKAAARGKAMADRFNDLARMLIERRGERVMIYGLSNQQAMLVKALERLGAPDGLFHPDSLIGPGMGPHTGLSDEVVAKIFRLYGADPSRSVRSYAMSEVLSQMPMCEAGRYHAPPWQAVIMVDRDGETPLPQEGEVEGRVALFDFLIEGRWGGFLTGDKATLDHGDCQCGRPGPTILDGSISRYNDLDDDKLSCAGSIDSSIRGAIQS
jgi:hypothetical protein